MSFGTVTLPSFALPPRAPREDADAAVTLIFAGGAFPLLKRSEHPLDPWSGHLALPGGRRDPEDHSIRATAERECLEEVGLELAESAFRGYLPAVETQGWRHRRPLLVQPVVYELAHRPAFSASEEVAAVAWVDLAQLLACPTSLRHESGHDFPAWQCGLGVVWGLTHRILADAWELLGTTAAAAAASSPLNAPRVP